MQQNLQEIPQPQMIDQNPQMQMVNPQQSQPQNQLYQIIQTDSTPNHCEKLSNYITGSKNIPIVVFLILMAISGALILNIVGLFSPITAFSSLGNILFALFVWTPMAIKIENNTSTVRYGCLFLINCSLLCVMSISFPLSLNRIWCFVLFETLLIVLSNKDKKIKFFGRKMGGRAVIILSIVYNLFFNWYLFYCLIITGLYTFVYQKYLINKFNISNEKVERIENTCFIKWVKKKLTTFISLKDVLEKGQQNQPLVQNNNIENFNNSSFIPVNMYPNYYSEVAPGMQQMQSIPQGEDNINQPPQ